MKNHKIFSLLAAAAVLMTCIFLVSCGGDGSGPASEGSELFTCIENGRSTMTVVRPEGDAVHDDSVSAARSIYSALGKYSEDIELGTDWSRDGTHDPDAIEILVGHTNYPESKQVLSGLDYGEYCISLLGNKIIVSAFDRDGMENAANELVSIFERYATVNDDGSYTLKIEKSALNTTGAASAGYETFPRMGDLSLESIYNAGDSCKEFIFGDADLDGFNASLDQLLKDGYTLYTSREINGSTFATLYNDTYTVNTGYYQDEKKVRMIYEPFRPETLIGLEDDNQYDAITTSQITMLGVDYKNEDDEYRGNGMSILIRLCDGRFIVVDGGFNTSGNCNALLETMKDQSKDYIAETGGIRVAAWIITHSHVDHNGMINGNAETIKENGITVERFIFNFMDDSEREKAIKSYTEYWFETEGSEWTKTYEAASTLGADIVIAHVGQIFYFANVKLDVLFTLETYAPAIPNALNATSVIIKMTFTDPETETVTTYMSTGDATGKAFELTLGTFGEYLKSDIVQLAHHGHVTYGCEKGTKDAYLMMAPSLVLWPKGDYAFLETMNSSFNTAITSEKINPNIREIFIAGMEGKRTVVKLPYEPGNVTVTEP